MIKDCSNNDDENGIIYNHRDSNNSEPFRMKLHETVTMIKIRLVESSVDDVKITISRYKL